MRRSDHPDLSAWSQVEPPPALDALVRQRATAVLERRRAEALQPRGTPSLVPAAKRPGFALEIVAYAAQITGSAARLIWRAVAG